MNTTIQPGLVSRDGNWIVSEGQISADQPRLSRTVRLHRFSRRCVPVPILFGAIRITDGCIFMSAGIAAAGLCKGPAAGPAIMTALLGGYLFAACLAAGKAYATRSLVQPSSWTLRIILAEFVALVGVTASLMMTGQVTPATPTWVSLWAGLSALAVMAAREVTRRAILRWRRLGRLGRRVAVLGCSPAAENFVQQAASHQIADVTVTGVYDDRQSERGVADMPVRGSIDGLLADARRDRVDAVVIVQPLSKIAEVEQICERLRSLVADIYVLSDGVPLRGGGDDIQALEGGALLRVGTRPLDDWQRLRKAVFDVVLGSIFLVLLSPLLLLIGAIIRLDSQGPILFCQPRQGYDNQSFTCLKFRTMYANMTDLLADRQTTRDDPRVTGIGRWLRRTSLDELPQLINVICGDMSLVGPRPHAPNTKVGNTLFHHVVDDYEMRHRVKPGITGWAQVNGWRGETTTLDQLHNRIAFDMFYIQNWSLWLDIKILVLTVVRELVSRTAY